PQCPPHFRGFSDAGPGCATAWRLAERAQTSGARLALAIMLLIVNANKRSGRICSDIVLCSLIGTCRAPVLYSCHETCLVSGVYPTHDKVIKGRDRVCLRPEANLAGTIARIPMIQEKHPIERGLDMFTNGHHAEGMPLA